jgi:hypothetical protein
MNAWYFLLSFPMLLLLFLRFDVVDVPNGGGGNIDEQGSGILSSAG